MQRSLCYLEAVMNNSDLLSVLHLAERLKDTTRHCYTSKGRRESVAEHCFRLALMAYLMKDEFENLDINKVIVMCLFHDMGEAFTGDIPVFQKTNADREKEDRLIFEWVDGLPDFPGKELRELYAEMNEQKTGEAKLYKALDCLEALIQHNESDISTWEPHEYELQLTYAYDRVGFSEYIHGLRDYIRDDSMRKIEESRENGSSNN